MTWKKKQLEHWHEKLKEARMTIAYLSCLPADSELPPSPGIDLDTENFRITSHEIPPAVSPEDLERLRARVRAAMAARIPRT